MAGLIRTPKEEGHYTLKRVTTLPKRGNYNHLYALRETNIDRLYRYQQDGTYEEIFLGSASTGIQSVVAGTNVTVDNTDPNNPIVNAADTTFIGLTSVVAGTDITIDTTDPNNPVINSTASSSGLQSVVAGTNVSVDNTDPNNPIINSTDTGLQSVVAGTNITVDNTDPLNPIVNATAGGGGINSVVAGDNVTVDNTDPSNPIVSSTRVPTILSAISVTDVGNAAASYDDLLTLTVPGNTIEDGECIYFEGKLTLGGTPNALGLRIGASSNLIQFANSNVGNSFSNIEITGHASRQGVNMVAFATITYSNNTSPIESPRSFGGSYVLDFTNTLTFSIAGGGTAGTVSANSTVLNYGIIKLN